jgi:hypothetical protein
MGDDCFIYQRNLRNLPAHLPTNIQLLKKKYNIYCTSSFLIVNPRCRKLYTLLKQAAVLLSLLIWHVFDWPVSMEEEQKKEELYKVTRSQVEHIDNTLSQRTIWLVISQSFFVSGYAVLITGNPNDPALLYRQHALLVAFPVASIIFIILSGFDIISGSIYLRQLRLNYEKNEESRRLTSNYPPMAGFKMLSALKNFSPIAVPVGFIILWLYILCL